MDWQAFDPQTAARLQTELLEWFGRNRRDLPWRRAPSAYAVWIAEIMLQQTQVGRVVDYFRRWMLRFPDVRSLAGADEDEVLACWEGLGYYARARNALKTARIVRDDYGGRFPEDFRSLLSLPGIGPYTAGAIMSQAFGRDYPAVDANARRVLCRIFDLALPASGQSADKRLQEPARSLIPPGRAGELNQALMELGALVCLPAEPLCGSCPAAGLCLAWARGNEGHRPLPAGGARIIDLVWSVGVCLCAGRVLLRRRPETGLWAGLWEFPGGSALAGEDPAACLKRRFPAATGLEICGLEHVGSIRHGYTNHRLRIHCYVCRPGGEGARPQPAAGCSWMEVRKLRFLALPSPYRKLVQRLAASRRINLGQELGGGE
jgi:A/G-specific adenine glycosylase